MGANGSTAASCSSLEHQQLSRQHLKYRQISQNSKPRKADQMSRYSNSYFNLSDSPSIIANQRNRLSDYGQPEAYGVASFDVGAREPLKYVPEIYSRLPANQAHRRSNAGVARCIQHQRKPNMREFSDSLPSLDMVGQQDRIISVHPKQMNPYRLSQQSNHRSSEIDRIKHTDSHLADCKKRAYISKEIGSSRSKPHLQNVNVFKDQDLQLLRRAVSLSSLHNLNQDHNKSNHCNQEPIDRCHRNERVTNLTTFITCCEQKDFSCDVRNQRQLMNRCKHCSPPIVTNMPPSSSNNYHNQQTPLTKKILKFKRLTAKNPPTNQSPNEQQQQQPKQLCAKKYKQNPNLQPQQQGCPVLPPLPRSQSLHELIRLRSTENGQRMRTTGTLRGGQAESSGNDDSLSNSNKVNLVNEVLEQRRQQLINHEPTNDLDQSLTHNSNHEVVGISIDENPNTVCHQRHNQQQQLRLSLSSQVRSIDVDQAKANKQRVFKKNENRFSQQPKINHHPINDNSHALLLSQTKHNQVNEVNVVEHKSTLRRSISHSALNHHSLDSDKDDSDDLNEFARFMHHFSQRQANSRAVPQQIVDDGATRLISGERIESSFDHNCESIASNSCMKNTLSSQQSPDSTTSSSGFASSNSVSSSISRELRGIKPQNGAACMPVNQIKSPKKYPAPPRPDEAQHIYGQNRYTSSKSKLINGGQLKLSSSLLSIVGECDSSASMGSQDMFSTNLALILRGDSHPSANKSVNGLTSLQASPNITTSTIVGQDDRSKGKTKVCDQVEKSKIQLEQLKRYSQLIQKSQSELALNHLTSPGFSSQFMMLNNKSPSNSKTKRARANGQAQKKQQRPQQYTSKFINLIKRKLSDKVETCGSNNYTGDQVSESIEPVGGQRLCWESKEIRSGQSNAIHQNRLISFTTDTEQKQPNSYDDNSPINENKKLNNSGYVDHNNDNKIMTRCIRQDDENAGSCMWKAGESLCDLNFDCDLELIRKCKNSSGSNERKKQIPPVDTKELKKKFQDPSMLIRSPTKPYNNYCCEDIKAAKGFMPTKQSIWPVGINTSQKSCVNTNCPYYKSTKSEPCAKRNGNENWRLLPNSLISPLLGEQQCKPVAQKKTKKQDLSNRKEQSHQSKILPVKQSKWTSGGWLMSSKNIDTCGEKVNNVNAQKPNPSNQSNFASKLMHSSGIQTPTKIPSKEDENHNHINRVNSATRFANEASELLEELDNSLDLVSAHSDRDSQCRKLAKSYWDLSDHDEEIDLYDSESFVKLGDGPNYQNDKPDKIKQSIDDDDIDCDYATQQSIYRAMVRATFDTGDTSYNKLWSSNQFPSPSSSFIFQLGSHNK